MMFDNITSSRDFIFFGSPASNLKDNKKEPTNITIIAKYMSGVNVSFIKNAANIATKIGVVAISGITLETSSCFMECKISIADRAPNTPEVMPRARFSKEAEKLGIINRVAVAYIKFIRHMSMT